MPEKLALDADQFAGSGSTTLKAIADALNAEAIPAPKGGRWAISTVAYVTDNPKYRGAIEYLFRWNGSEAHVLQPGAHKAIIP
ncbi:recombinase family protein [Methylobacterium sp. CM6257]